jgi:ATP adenylyltransferase
MDHLWTPWRYNYVSRADKDRRKGVPAALDAWQGDLDCVFCNMIASVDFAIAAGTDASAAEQAAYILYRGKTCYLCLNGFPYSTGHVLIVPYHHVDSLAALEAPEAIELIALAQATETALRHTYHPDGLNFGLNLGESAGAGVANHIHMHGLPRWSGDTNFMTVTAETRVLPETLEVTWSRLRPALIEATFTQQPPLY